MFAWQSENRGHDVHIQSNPTAAALMHKEFLQQKEVLKDKSSASILDKYGGEQYLQAVPKELRVGQTENYVEYDRRGKVIKGMERAKAKSKYDEDSAFDLLHSLASFTCQERSGLDDVVERLAHALLVCAQQSIPATTNRSGARGTSSPRANGATHAATRPSKGRIAVRPPSLFLPSFSEGKRLMRWCDV